MDKSFAETIRERVAGVELISEAIAEQGREADVRDLRVLLLNVVSLTSRDPGLEAAVDDLDAAARVIAKDASAGVHPVARHVRFLRSAFGRFSGRISFACGRQEAGEDRRFQGFAAAYAVQLERLAACDGESQTPSRSAA